MFGLEKIFSKKEEEKNEMPAPLGGVSLIESSGGRIDRLTEAEHTLVERDIVEYKELHGTANRTAFVRLKDDGAGIFKPKSGEGAHRPRGSMQGLPAHFESSYGELYRRERAAYLVDKFFDFRVVPPTVIREDNGEVGSLQQFIEGAESFYSRGKLDKTNLYKIFLIDLFIWNNDRHAGNAMKKDGYLYAIDNGFCLSSKGGPLLTKVYPLGFVPVESGLEGVELSRMKLEEKFADSIVAAVADDVRLDVLREQLTELVGDAPTNSCIARIKKIAEEIEKYGGDIPRGLILSYNEGA